MILVSRYMFLTMPDPITPLKFVSNIHVTSKSNMAANMAAIWLPCITELHVKVVVMSIFMTIKSCIFVIYILYMFSTTVK